MILPDLWTDERMVERIETLIATASGSKYSIRVKLSISTKQLAGWLATNNPSGRIFTDIHRKKCKLNLDI